MKKKLISMLLTGTMLIGLLTGCGDSGTGNADGGSAGGVQSEEGTSAGGTQSEEGASAEGSAEASDSGEWTGEVSHVVMTYLTLGNTPADLDKVQNAINERTVKEIGVEIEMRPISAYDAMSQFPTWLATGERIDLMFPLLQNVNSYVNQGLIQPLTELIAQNAPYIQQMTDEGWTFASNNTIDGEIWSILQVPNVTGSGGGYLVETKYIEEAEMTFEKEKIYTLDDLTELFGKIKEKHPDMYPCGIVSTNRTSSEYSYYGIADSLGAGSHTGVLMGTDSTTVVNLFESEEYKDYINHIREWFLAGYIHPDAATTDATTTSLLNSGVTSGYFMVSAPIQMSEGQTMIRLSELYQASQGMGGWVIPRTAEEPEAAMRFLNLMYEDPSLANLIQWGIEGEHYVVLDESINLVGFPEGIDNTTSGYYNTLGLYGDFRKTYVWSAAQSQADNDAYSEEAMANKTQGVGMIYNPSTEMEVKITAISAVIAQYLPALESGSVDIDQYYQQFIDALKAAGIDDVIAEKQSQFDAWRAAQ